MKTKKIFLVYASIVVALLFAANFYSGASLFQTLNSAGESSSSSKGTRFAPALQSMHEQITQAEDADAVKRAFKALESISGYGNGSEAMEKTRRLYAPAIAHYANRPKEAEKRYQLIKKKDFMEMLVNAYRKELPNGDIPVRSQLLNVLFDTQNSLVSDGEETELAYIKRSNERLTSLKQMAASNRDAAQQYRITSLDTAFGLYEKSFQMGRDWQKQKTEILSRTEKSLSNLLNELKLNGESSLDEGRRSFLLSAIFLSVALLISLGLIYFGSKHLNIRFERRAALLASYLKGFASERDDPKWKKEMSLLEEDEDWMPLYMKVREAEERFVASTSTQLAVSKSITLPYVVFHRDGSSLYWNSAAEKILSIGSSQTRQSSLDEVISTENIEAREGESSAIVEMIRNSFSAPKEDVFEIFWKSEDQSIPMELVSCPITSGPLAGSKVYLFREIRKEAERIEKSVECQVSILRDLVHKITHHYPTDCQVPADSSPAVSGMAQDLSLMKMKIDERETLWKSETSALLEQVDRQKEILAELKTEIDSLKVGNNEAKTIFSKVMELEEDIFDEVSAMERNLSKWIETRKRMQLAVTHQSETIGKIQTYESSLRDSASEIKNFLKALSEDLTQLQTFKEDARLQAINLSFSPVEIVPAEYTDKARSFANSLGSFCDRLQSIGDRLQALLHRHPGGTLYPQLDTIAVDEEILEWIKDEQLKLGQAVQRWKEAGVQALNGGEKVKELLQETETRGAVAARLGETVMLINEQTQENLQRW